MRLTLWPACAEATDSESTNANPIDLETFKGYLQHSGFRNVLNRPTERNRSQVVLRFLIRRYSYDTGPVSR
jgi:hypothetical protein